MTDFEYPGIRMTLEASLERMRQVIKIDISTDDVMIPSAVEYKYKLMFEDSIRYSIDENRCWSAAESCRIILGKAACFYGNKDRRRGIFGGNLRLCAPFGEKMKYRNSI